VQSTMHIYFSMNENVQTITKYHVHCSLLALSHVMADLARSRNGFINYRESTLTRILQKDLKSQCKLAIICCISPSGLYTEQTRKTFEFGKYAKGVKTRPMVKDVLDNRSLIIKTLRCFDKARSEPGYPESQRKVCEEEWNKIENSMLVGADICTLLEEENIEEENPDTIESGGLVKVEIDAEAEINAEAETEAETEVEAEIADEVDVDDEPETEAEAEAEATLRLSAVENNAKMANEERTTSHDLSAAEMKIIEMQEEWSSIKEASGERMSVGNYSPAPPIRSPNEIPDEIQFLVAEQKILEIQEEWSSIKGAGGDDIQLSGDEASANLEVGGFDENGSLDTSNHEEENNDVPSLEEDAEHRHIQNNDSSQLMGNCSNELVSKSPKVQDCGKVQVTQNLSSDGSTPGHNSLAVKYESDCIEKISHDCESHLLTGDDHDMISLFTESESSIFFSPKERKTFKDQASGVAKDNMDDRGSFLLSYSEDTASENSKKKGVEESRRASDSKETNEMITRESYRDLKKQSDFMKLLRKFTSEDYENAKDEEKLVILKTSVAQLNAENYELKNELDGCYEMEKAQIDTIDNTRAENKRLIQQVEGLKEEYDRIQKEASAATEYTISKDSDCTNKILDDCASSSLEAMSGYFSDSDSSYPSPRKTKSRGLLKKLTVESSRASDNQTNNRDLQKQNGFVQLLRKFTSDDYENAKNEEKLVILESCVSQLNAESYELKNELDGCYEMEKAQIDTIDNTRAENKRLIQQIEGLKKDNDRIQKEASAASEYKSENKSLKVRIDMLITENKSLHKDNLENADEYIDLKGRVSSLEKENQNLRKDAHVATSHKSEINGLKDQMKWLEIENESLRKDAHIAAECKTEIIDTKHLICSLEKDFSTSKLNKRTVELSELSNKIMGLGGVFHDTKGAPTFSAALMPGDDQREVQNNLLSDGPSFSLTSKESSEMSVFSSTESSLEDSMKSPIEDAVEQSNMEGYYAFDAIEEDSITDKENIGETIKYAEESMDAEEKSVLNQKQNTEEDFLKQWENLSCTFKDYRQTVLGVNKSTQGSPRA
jgi:hypothetical protein